MLNDVGASVLGAVLTMMPTRGSGAYSYNYYYYGGSYGDSKTEQPAVSAAPDADAVASDVQTGDEAAETAGLKREASE
jgi:receptor protein-tyrosine kinase